MRAVLDIETNALEGSTKLHLCGGKNLDTGEVYQFENCHSDPVAAKEAYKWHQALTMGVGHNYLSFDVPELTRFLGRGVINPSILVDTVIVSRLHNYDIMTPVGGDNPHSLKSWGLRLGVHKGDFKEFETLTDEMRTYWKGDLDTGEALYNHFLPVISDPNWRKALRCEHDVQIELERARHFGFQFDKETAERLLVSVKSKMVTLEDSFQRDFPPKLEQVNTLKYRVKQDGTVYSNIEKAYQNYPITKQDASGENLLCYDYILFNPGSSRDRADVLWEAGWKPFDKTKTHIKFDRLSIGDPYGKKIKAMDEEFYNDKKKDLARYGWTVAEDNLLTLPEDAPEGARNLAQWLTLEGRRSSLEEWIGQVKEDGRIHGRINCIGAWTGRCSHNDPNTANIASPFRSEEDKQNGKNEPKNAVEEVKDEYDLSMRGCWTVPSGSWLVGVDADGIQLRVLADYLWRHFDADMYAKAIMEGRKEDETDIHNVNKRALEVPHVTRYDAKTFIYSWLLGAGVAKTASILKVNQKEASVSRYKFEQNIDGLSMLKKQLVPYVADKGFFLGYDGREVVVPSAYKTLAGILQNGEALLMKHTMLRWVRELRAQKSRFKLAGFIHDEYQTEVIGTREEAEEVGRIQAEAMLITGQELGFKIPTPGSADVGRNWAETH